MRTNIIIGLVLALIVVAVITALVLLRPTTTPQNSKDGVANRETLTIEGLLERLKKMDASGDGLVSEKEFALHYGEEAGFILHRGPDQPAMTAKEVYNFLDQNRSGEIDPEDLYIIENYKTFDALMRTAAKGLTLRAFFSSNIECNSLQLQWVEEELGASRRGDLPFGDQYFNASYFTQWSAVTFKDGTRKEGFVRRATHAKETDRLLTLGARIEALLPDTVTRIEPLPDSPYTVYARAIKDPNLKPDNKQANLDLARELTKQGLKTEAKRLFKRVLIMERDNAEGLAALGLKMKAGSLEYEPR